MRWHLQYLLTAAVLAVAPAWAESAAPSAPAFTNLRFDEDWSSYKPEDGGTWLAPVKHVPLGNTVWASFGGELRLRWEYFDGFNFDDANEDNYLLYRTFLHADLHVGDHWRIFVQGRFSDAEYRDLPGGNREALDYDEGDLWNSFVEFRYPCRDVKVMGRVGRMELQFGKQRILSPLDWSNNRRIFDGALLQVAGASGHWSIDAFVTRPVLIDGDAFTWNPTDDNRAFAGLYYAQKLGKERKHTLEAYLLYQQRDAASLVREDLYTLGGRAFGPIYGNLTYEAEAAWQFGNREISGRFFDTALDIEAWMLSAEVKYTFAETWGKPFLALGLDYASGDGDPADGQVETFNPLYPLGHAYFGYIDTVSRQNIQAIKLGTGIALVPNKVTAAVDYHFFWRADESDALYNAGTAVVRAPVFVTPGGRTVTAQDQELGQELDLTFTWNVNRNLSFTAGYSHFFTGAYLEETGVSDDTDFVYVQSKLTF